MDQKIQAFHTLPGITISEKTKSFRTYLHQLENEFGKHQGQLEYIINSITPRTYLETVFKIDVLLHFCQFTQIIEVIKTENTVLIGRIFKNNWFFDELVKNFTAEKLVNDFFKYISYVTRTKIISKLTNKCNVNNEYGTQLFEAYHKKYGIHAAKQLLPLCSSEKIKALLINNELKLSTSLLKRLIQKYPNLVSVLAVKHHGSLMTFIPKHDIHIFWELMQNETYYTGSRVGRKSTNKLIQIYKEDIIQKPEKYVRALKLPEVTKRMGHDFNNLYCNYFINLRDDGRPISEYHELYTCIKHLSKQRQMALYEQAYTKTFNRDPFENIEKVDAFLIDYFVDRRKGNMLAEAKYNSNKNRVWFIPLMAIEKSIPILKEKIALSSDPTVRANLMKFLVETCKFNNDLSALLEVGKYVLKRHRNDSFSVRTAFMCNLFNNFKIEELDDEHWKYILELLKLFKLNNEALGERQQILQKHLLHSWLNNLPIKQLITDFLKEFGTDGISNCLKGSPEFKRVCLELVHELLPEVFTKPKELAEGYRILFIETNNFNKNYFDQENIKMDVLEQHLLENLEILLEENTDLSNVFWYFINNKESAIRKKIINLFWKQKVSGLHNVRIIHRFLLHQPEDILENFEAFSSPGLYNFLVENYTLLYVIRRYHQLTQNLVEKALLDLKNENCDQRANAIRLLSFLISENDYCDLASEFRPDEARLDLESIETMTIYPIQVAICESFKNLHAPNFTLPHLLFFCKGDYLKNSRASLYSVVYHASELKVYPALEKLLETPALSVRKHGVFLSAAVLDVSTVYGTFEKFTKTEEISAMYVHLFESAFKYFCKTIDDKFLNLVREFVVKVHDHNEEAFKLLVDAKKVPKEFLARYIEFAWNLLEEKEPEIEKLKYELLNEAKGDIIHSFSAAFIEKVITKNFHENWRVYAFIFVYLFCVDRPESTDERLQLIFNTLQKIKQSNSRVNYLKIAHSFTEGFVYFALKLETIEIPVAFKKRWEEIVNVEEAIHGHIMMSILILHLETSSNDYIDIFNKKIGLFLMEIEEKYQTVTVVNCEQIISKIIRTCCERRTGTPFINHALEFFKKLLTDQFSVSSALYVTKFIISNLREFKKLSADFSDIIKLLNDRQEPVVKVHLNEFIKQIDAEDD